MDEQEKTQDTAENSVKDNGNGIPAEKGESTSPLLDETKTLVDAMKKENKLKKELLDREEKLLSDKMLSGRSELTEKEKSKSAEELKKDKAAEFFKGSAIEDAINKYG